MNSDDRRSGLEVAQTAETENLSEGTGREKREEIQKTHDTSVESDAHLFVSSDSKFHFGWRTAQEKHQGTESSPGVSPQRRSRTGKSNLEGVSQVLRPSHSRTCSSPHQACLVKSMYAFGAQRSRFCVCLVGRPERPTNENLANVVFSRASTTVCCHGWPRTGAHQC